MNHQKLVTEAFERLGFAPRPGQAEAVDKILTAFLDENIRNVCLCAPTGTGKSIIGAATAEALSASKVESNLSSISLTATNTLSKQYSSTFTALEKFGRYAMLKGAANYTCEVLTTPEEEHNAESCLNTVMKKSHGFDKQLSICSACDYMRMKMLKNTVKHLTTNYAYYFIDKLYSRKFLPRDLIVWDEAHLINDLFSDHCSIYFSHKRLEQMKEEIVDKLGVPDTEILKILNQISRDCISGKVTDKNYKSYLTALSKVYVYARDNSEEARNKALDTGDIRTYAHLSKFFKKYEGLHCKIDDFFKFDYEHIVEIKEDEKSVAVKPIFVGTMFDKLHGAPYNLFMSATISPEFLTTTLGLTDKDVKFIKLPPTFPRENKEIVFFNPLSLNYKSMQDPKIVAQLKKNVAKIVQKHVGEGQRGIILVPSFKLQNEIVNELLSASWSKSFKLFDQRQGEKLENVLSAFKEYKGGPAVLISPAMFEGIDLPGDLSRFQILVKAPYPSLGDKRQKFILDHHPNIYSLTTLMKCVQGAGRSVRSATDHAITYCLDNNLQRLWSSNQNVWKDEFNTRYTNFLM